MRKCIGLIDNKEVYLSNTIEVLIGGQGVGKTFKANEYIANNYKKGAIIISDNNNITEEFLKTAIEFKSKTDNIEEDLKLCLNSLSKSNIYISFDEIKNNIILLNKLLINSIDKIKFLLLDDIRENILELINCLSCDICIISNSKDVIKDFSKNCLITTWDYKNNMDCSGNISLRVPKSLHMDLIIKAKLEEEVSLNQYIMYLLSRNI